MKVQILQITAAATLPLRHPVLWPDHPVDFSRVEGDESALHFGAFMREELVCVLSLFEDGGSMRIRKFATRRDCQGNGIGTRMMHHALIQAKTRGAERVWLSARTSAMPFYERFGFAAFGDPSLKQGQPYRKMQLDLKDQSLASSA